MVPNINFQEGFQRQLETRIKSAVGIGRAAQILIDPLERGDFVNLGRKLFNKSLKGITPYTIRLAGYKGIRNAHAATEALNRARIGGASPAIIAGHHAALEDIFANIGATAAPRIRAAQTGVPLAGGLAAGGLGGYGLGAFNGRHDENEHLRNELAELPLMDRMRYLLNPEGMRPQ